MRVFVSTVYKNQELAGGHKHEYIGDWVDFEDCVSESNFYDKCEGIHSDEENPQFLFLKYEGFDEEMPKEILAPGNKVNPGLFEYIYDCDENDRNVMLGYYDNIGVFDLESAHDAFQSKYDTIEDFVSECIENSTGGVAIPDWIVIDSQATWENLQSDFFCYEKDGEFYIFNNN